MQFPDPLEKSKKWLMLQLLITSILIIYSPVSQALARTAFIIHFLFWPYELLTMEDYICLHLYFVWS